MKFKAIAEITVGQNITREKETNQKYYTNDDLIADLHAIPIVIIRNGIEDETPDANNHEIRAGDVLYSVVTSTAAIVSPQNDGKRLNQNIAKMTLTTGQLDPRYLCYAINESKDIQKQMAAIGQGTVKRILTPAMLGEITITFPDLATQEKIGEAYFKFNRQQYLANLELELQKKVYFEVLKKIDHKMKRGKR